MPLHYTENIMWTIYWLFSHIKKFVNNLKNLIPTKKMNDFSDVEAAIDYLLEEKNRNTNGINLIVDGGRTII